MSFVSKWRQFVNWVHEQKAADINAEFEPDLDQQQPTSWPEGEYQAKATEFDESKKWWVTMGLFAASYWDSKAGTGTPLPANKGPVTGNNDTDALLITGGAIVVVIALWSIIKRFIA